MPNGAEEVCALPPQRSAERVRMRPPLRLGRGGWRQPGEIGRRGEEMDLEKHNLPLSDINTINLWILYYLSKMG
jgi:hypothetical protein